MVLKKSAALAAVAVIAAAGVSPAAEIATERMNVQLPVVLPGLGVPAIPTAEQAVSLPSNIAMPAVSIPAAARLAAPSAQPAAMARLASNPQMAVISGQQKGDQAAALNGYFENGRSQKGPDEGAVDEGSVFAVQIMALPTKSSDKFVVRYRGIHAPFPEEVAAAKKAFEQAGLKVDDTNPSTLVVEGNAATVAKVVKTLRGWTSAPYTNQSSSLSVAVPSARLGLASYEAANAGTLGDYIHRAINVVLGWIGLGLHKAETPEVLAQRLMDELNAEGPKLNTLVAQASKQVELIRMQVANDEKESARLDGLAQQATKNYAAATDPAVQERLKTAAMSLDTQKTQIDAGLATNKTQLASAEGHLKEMKQHRDDFFYERQQKMAAIRSKLSQVQAAKMDGELAKLEASFKVGDHKDLDDAFNRAADDAIATGKGQLDAAQSSPEEQLKEIERSARHDSAEDSFNERLKKLGKTSSDAGKAGTVGDYFHRAINVVLGWIGLGLHKAETPELLAQRLMDELNAEGPKLNTLVAGASKQVELLRMQVADNQKESDRLNGLADAAAKRFAEAKDPAVQERLKTAAMSLDTQKTQIDTALATNKEQLAHAEAHLKEMKQKRDDFFYERQQKMAAIRSKLSQVQAAKMDGELAKLEASFKVGDHKDLDDAFNRAADDAIATGKGQLDAAQSSPEEQLKEIERSARHDTAEDSFNERLKKLGQKDSK